VPKIIWLIFRTGGSKKNEEKILRYLIVASCPELILRKKAAIHLLKWCSSRVAAGSGESEKEHQLEIWGCKITTIS
jgi:hypothetical protein